MSEDKTFTEDEAIELFEWRAKYSNGKSYEMLAKWLKELKLLRKFRYDKNAEFWKEFNSIKSFRVENEKLRELIEDFLPIICINGFCCYGCKYDEFAECDYRYKCKLLERARALGFKAEVGE